MPVSLGFILAFTKSQFHLHRMSMHARAVRHLRDHSVALLIPALTSYAGLACQRAQKAISIHFGPLYTSVFA